MTTRWSVPRDWEGETVAVLASGPSMSQDIADYVRGRARVIAVNNQGIPTYAEGKHHPALAPWADVLYASDPKWWRAYQEDALKFAGLKVTVRTTLEYADVLSLELSVSAPFDPRPTHLVSGGNSGYQAIHLAAHFGAARILLCGFDMRAVDGRKHWFGNHFPRGLDTLQKYAVWIQNIERLAQHLLTLGVRVINCTPKSALRGVERGVLTEVLQ